jgi:hypothetical protein
LDSEAEEIVNAGAAREFELEEFVVTLIIFSAKVLIGAEGRDITDAPLML